MKALSPKQRRECYSKSEPGLKWPDSCPWVGGDNRLYSIWIMGNNYHNKTTYHGAYPPNYLDRILALFPDAENIMHLFSGSLPKGNYTRVDMRTDIDTDVVCDAQNLGNAFEPGLFDLVLADPPYTDEDANKYGNPMVNRNTVLKEIYKILPVGGFCVWLDQVWPMYRKVELRLAGAIGIIRSTNHRFRVATIFEKIS